MTKGASWSTLSAACKTSPNDGLGSSVRPKNASAKTTCAACNRKATQNLKLVDGVATTAGPSKELGAEERYLPMCYRHYRERLALSQADAQASMAVRGAGI